MKINVTPELRKAIKSAIEKDRDAKLQALNLLDIRRSPLDEIQRRRDEYEKAEAQAMQASKLIAGTDADFNVTTGALTWGELPDHRPANWREGWSWRVPSRSGGLDHEVTVGRANKNYKSIGYTDYVSACNCHGGNFNGTCWAQESVVKYLKSGDSLDRPAGTERVWYSSTNPDFGKRRESYDD